MTTLVATIPHSGSNFLVKYLVGVLGLDEGEAASADFLHVYTHPEIEEDTSPFDTLIITVRHPHSIVKTDKFAGGSAQNVADNWKCLVNLRSKFEKVFPVVIDGPEKGRFLQLMAIAEHFGCEDREAQIRKYADDWRPVNENITDEDIATVQNAVDVYDQWLL